MNTVEMIDLIQRGTDRLSRKVLLAIAQRLKEQGTEIGDLRRLLRDLKKETRIHRGRHLRIRRNCR